MEMKIGIHPLMNCSIGHEELEFRLLNIGDVMFNHSVNIGGSDELKKIIRERLDFLFNHDICAYFGHDATEEVENCINELAKGNDACVCGERFWWDLEEVVFI